MQNGQREQREMKKGGCDEDEGASAGKGRQGGGLRVSVVGEGVGPTAAASFAHRPRVFSRLLWMRLGAGPEERRYGKTV